MLPAFIAVLLFVCIPMTLFAEEMNMIDDTGKSVTISVKAVFAEHNDPNVYKDIIINGSASITTRNGISVTVTCGAEAFEPGTRLAVHEITAEEKEAYDWFSHVMEGTGTDILPFDISFEKNGQSIPLNSKIQIDITLPGGYTAPVVISQRTAWSSLSSL